MRGNDVGGNFATMLCCDTAESGNDARQGEEATVACDDTQEIPDQTLDARLVGDRADSVKLVFRRKTGLEISRLRSSLPLRSASKRPRSFSTAATEFASSASSKSDPA